MAHSRPSSSDATDAMQNKTTYGIFVKFSHWAQHAQPAHRRVCCTGGFAATFPYTLEPKYAWINQGTCKQYTLFVHPRCGRIFVHPRCGRTGASTCKRSTVSRLCANTSSPEAARCRTAARSPRKSGVRHSTSVCGRSAFSVRTCAPPHNQQPHRSEHAVCHADIPIGSLLEEPVYRSNSCHASCSQLSRTHLRDSTRQPWCKAGGLLYTETIKAPH